jgi:aryl-alcohol dehydrogenase-like predicted oxidoreductase
VQYRTLGRTGVQVSSLVLGAMNFGSLAQTSQDEVNAIVRAAPSCWPPRRSCR